MIAAFNSSGRITGYFNDIFAVTWTEPYKSTIKQCKASLAYYGTEPEWKTKQITVNAKASGLYSNYVSFPKYRSFVSGIPTTHFINKGSFIMTVYCSGNYPNLGGYAAYGYTYLNVSPSVSFPGSLSIVFGKGMKTLDSDRFYA